MGLVVENVTVKNFRCFRQEQTARLAPLTFLVGENSTGKTSFLALLRVLWDIAFRGVSPDFRRPPYDLGSFEDIVYQQDERSRPADSFEAGFEHRHPRVDSGTVHFQAVFKERQGVLVPVVRRFAGKDAWIESDLVDAENFVIRFGIHTEKWERRIFVPDLFVQQAQLFELFNLAMFSRLDSESGAAIPDEVVATEKWRPIYDLLRLTNSYGDSYAGAPLRSSPRRTYDPIRPFPDPGGEYIPAYLANVFRQDANKWQWLKGSLEKFGKQSGLFDEILVNSLGNSAGSPFQVRIRKYGSTSKGRTLKGPARNLMDVGYGVSQALPLIIGLLAPEAPRLFLLQQPEVHLHPSAQAALGTLFCSIAGPERQLVVETHSDYILDRVLLDIRDQKTELKPEDVSILYFEPNDLDVTIHSLRLDDRGTIVAPPDSYRRFFMDELRRSVGL